MRLSSVFVFLGLVISGALANAMNAGGPLSLEARGLDVEDIDARDFYDADFLEERDDNNFSIEARGKPSISIKVHLRDLLDEELEERDYFDAAAEEFDARFDEDEFMQERDLVDDQDLEARAGHGGPSATIHIHLRDLFEEDDLEERDYEDWVDELDARYYDELEERFNGIDDDVEARGDDLDIEVREPARHFRCGTVILHPQASED